MFEPNSIRSLLSKRQSSRISSAKSQSESDKLQTTESYSKLQTDLNNALQTKIMIKQIDHKIENIREWRNHQKQLIDEKLKCNSEVAKAQSQEYIKCLERQARKQEQELNKILKQLNSKQSIKIVEKQQEYDSQKIFKVLEETNAIRDAIKNQGLAAQDEQHSKFISELESLSTIFRKQKFHMKEEEEQIAPTEKISMDQFKKQIDEIQNQLKEIQDLLGDDDPAYAE